MHSYGKLLLIILSSVLASLCLQCTQPMAGTATETENVVGKLFQPDGKTPAVGVRVHIRPKNTLADTSFKLAKILTDTASTVTDDKGRFAFDTTIDTGTYVIEGSNGNNAVLIDSVIVKKRDSTDTLTPDTLKPAGAIKGIINLSEGGDPRKVFVLAFGIDRFARVNADGSFKFSGLGEAKYDLRFISSLDNYGVLDTVNISVVSADTTDLDTIEMPFIGIPTPRNVVIAYDTSKQIVTLSWDKTDTALAKGFYVYRRNVDSNTVLMRINTSPITDTLYRDSTGIQGQTYEYRVSAIDKNATESMKSAGVSVSLMERLILINDSASFGARSEHTSLNFGNKIWIIAGSMLNDVWSSTDGIFWTSISDSTAFSKRRSHASVVFNNEMWVIGGRDANRYQNDVWHSSDGKNWVLATDSAGFSGRMDHAAIVFENRIWVIGGYDGVSEKNDVWQSGDGVVWTKVVENASFPARAGLTVNVLKNELIIIGGVGSTKYYNDVWSSGDGIAWTEIMTNGGFSGVTGHTATVFQDQIWIVGGEKASDGYSNEIWSSNDGKNWSKFNTPNNFTAKYNHSAVVFDDKLWIIGQVMLPNGSLNKTDIWYLR